MTDYEIEESVKDFAETDLGIEDLSSEFWCSVVVAGLQYYEYGKEDEFAPGGRVLPAAGDRLLLEREPDNRADRNAIKVIWRNAYMLGHIPRSLAEDLAPELDAGKGARAYVVDPGAGGAWEMRIILVGPAVERMDGWRLESRPLEIREAARRAADAIWPEKTVERAYGPGATVGRDSWITGYGPFHDSCRGRIVAVTEPAAPAPTPGQRDAAWRFGEAMIEHVARRRGDAAFGLAALVDRETLPEGADVPPDPSLRGHVFGWWDDVPPWLMTRTTLRKYGLRPGKEIGPYAHIEYGTGRRWRRYELYAVNATVPLKPVSPAALAATVERQARDAMTVVL